MRRSQGATRTRTPLCFLSFRPLAVLAIVFSLLFIAFEVDTSYITTLVHDPLAKQTVDQQLEALQAARSRLGDDAQYPGLRSSSNATTYTERSGYLFFPRKAPLSLLFGSPESSFVISGNSNINSGGAVALPPLAVVESTSYASHVSRRNAAVHPISHLIAGAEQKWETMVTAQSQTLREAVSEYKSRYGRSPPRGFDQWFEYALRKNVILIDEYDSIDDDVTPFLALSPRLFNARAELLATDATNSMHQNSFTIHVEGPDGKDSSISGPRKGIYRAADSLNVMKSFLEYLPRLQLTVSSQDGPAVVVTGEAKQRAIAYAREAKVITDEQAGQLLDPAGLPPWPRLCNPNSAARRSAIGKTTLGPLGPSFISHDHVSAMSICHHPEIETQHGFTGWGGPPSGPLWPLFTLSKTTMHSDFLVPPMEQYWVPVGDDPAWEDKPNNKILWRGSTTGVWASQGSRWRSSQRARLVSLTNDFVGELAVRYAAVSLGDAVRQFLAPAKLVNDHYFDVKFTGKPIQCDIPDGTCEFMAKEFDFASGMSLSEQNNYRYVLDVDGNAWSGRFHRLMSSNTLVFKSTIFPEWYSKRVMPWYHYVPIKNDLTDLHDVAAYFIGTPDGKNDHEDAATLMAARGKEWAEKHWREEDMQAYQFRLILEYARLVHRDPDDLTSYDYIEDTNDDQEE